MAGYIPAANYYDMIGGIGDALTSGVKQYQQKQLLSDLGNDLAQGDYDSAAQKALRAGDMGTGLKLVELGRQAKTDASLKGYLGGGTIASLGQPPGGGNGAVAPESLLPFYKQAEAATGVPAAVLMAQHRQESAFNPNATGKAGEIGLGQILPSTARDPGYGLSPVDPEALRDPATNIMFSAKYLAARAKAAGQKDWSDPTKGLLAYNGGGDPDYVAHVSRYMPQGGGAAAPVQVAQNATTNPFSNIPTPVLVQAMQLPQYKEIATAELKRRMEPQGRDVPVTDPAERARLGFQPDDTRAVFVNSVTGKPTVLSESKATENRAESAKPRVVAPGGAIFQDGKEVYRNAGNLNATMPDETAHFLAERVIAGDKQALIGLGRGAQGANNLAKVQGLVAQKAQERGLDAQDILNKSAEIQGLNAQQRTFGTQTARMSTSSVEAQGAITLGRQASAAVDRGNWVPVNKAIQSWQRGTSNPELGKFAAANLAIVNTYARAINPTGQPTVADKEHAREILSTATGPDQYSAVLDQMQQEIDMAHNSPTIAKRGLENIRKGRPFMDGIKPDEIFGDAHGKPAAGVGVRSAPAKVGTTSSGIKWSVE